MSDQTVDEATGRIKEAAGALTGNQQLKRQGRLEQAKSSVKHAVGGVTDRVAGALGNIGKRK